MPMLNLTVRQVIELVKQLPQEEKSAVLHALKPEGETQREDEVTRVENQKLRALSSTQGLDWDNLNEDDQDVFRTKLLHKDS